MNKKDKPQKPCSQCGSRDFYKSPTSEIICSVCGQIQEKVKAKQEIEGVEAENFPKYWKTVQLSTQSSNLTRRLKIIERQNEERNEREDIQDVHSSEDDGMIENEFQHDTMFSMLGNITLTYCNIMAKHYHVNVDDVNKVAKQII